MALMVPPMKTSWSQNRAVRFSIFFALIGVCAFWGTRGHSNVEDVRAYFGQFPPAFAGVAFVVLYVALTFCLWLPKDFLRIAAAYVFGTYLSTLLIWIAESLNAVILFHLSRLLGRDFVADKLPGRFHRLDERLAHLGFIELFLLRVVLLVPYRFMDLAAGLTNIPFRTYFMAVLLGSPIRIFIRQFLWVAVGESLFERWDKGGWYFGQHPWAGALVSVYIAVTVWMFMRLKRRLFKPGLYHGQQEA